MLEFVFLLSCSLILYAYLVYPLILALLPSRDFSAPTILNKPKVSILMVVFNEEIIIERKLDNLLALDYPKELLSIFVIDDASTDKTRDIVGNYANRNVQLIEIAERKGKSHGLNVGMSLIKDEFVLMVDARQVLDKGCLSSLIEWFGSKEVGAVSGELLFRGDDQEGYAQGLGFYWTYEKWIRKNEARIASVPGVTGALYLMRRSLFKSIPEDTLIDDVLIPMQIIESGGRVVFDNSAIAWDIPSTNIKREKLRKVRTLKGNLQLLCRNGSWVLPGKHPIWWQFVSHKILRLFVPYFAILAFISSLALAINGKSLYLIYAAAFFIVVISFPASETFPNLKRFKVISGLSSFMALNWFAVLALYEFIRKKSENSWK